MLLTDYTVFNREVTQISSMWELDIYIYELVQKNNLGISSSYIVKLKKAILKSRQGHVMYILKNPQNYLIPCVSHIYMCNYTDNGPIKIHIKLIALDTHGEKSQVRGK